MRKLFSLAAALLLLPAFASAQSGPAVEVRLRSVNDLLEKVEYLGGVVNQAEPAKQGVAFIKALADDAKGIEGIDPARPTGLYASVTKDVVDSPVVLMIPLADEEAFLGLLTGKLGLAPKKGDDGAYKLDVPNVPVPVYFRFANKYVYATVQSAAGIDAKKLLDPKEFFAAKDDAVLSAKVFVDRLPDDVKKTVLAQFELKINDAKERKHAGETDAQRKLRLWGLDQATAAVQTVLAQGKELAVRVFVEPKSDDLSLEVAFSAKDGSNLAKVFRGLSGRTGIGSALASETAPVAAGEVKLALSDEARQSLGPVLDALVQEAIDKAKENDKAGAKLALDSVLPTAKAGELEAAFAVAPWDAGGKLSAVAAVKVVEGAGIEKTIKTFAAFFPNTPQATARFEFDAKKVGGVALHKITIASSPELKEAFGTETLWLGTSDRLLLLSVEADAKAISAAAQALEGKGTKARPLGAEVSVAGVVKLTEKGLKPDQVADAVKEAFGSEGTVRKDTFKLTVDGGDALTVRATLKGTAVKLMVLIDEAKKK
jgi:hypothetical protein